MVRTKAGGGGCRKVLVARAPRKVLGASSLNAGPSPAAKKGQGLRGGGNPVCVRSVPAWQRGIGEFLRLPQKETVRPAERRWGAAARVRPLKKLAPCHQILQKMAKKSRHDPTPILMINHVSPILDLAFVYLYSFLQFFCGLCSALLQN
ncbi:PCNA-associated factor [Athene cunicularia]|uniref:PCNA-associated factor n=1 Tax=Athene cunicularia TaxID=194338 RepID=UPI000EF71BC9|nr:PCNA-associated factor [Athene cunicularia]